MQMKSILRKNKSDIALVIGNGINRFKPSGKTNSWNELLEKLARINIPGKEIDIPSGISLTEFYDILELKSKMSEVKEPLQSQFCDLMSSWRYFDHHKNIVRWAQEANRPVLTLNFEEVLSDAGNCSIYRTIKGNFTDYYPWESYFGNEQIDDPNNNFGIWHINGMQRYSRSVRLGLTHYMGSVERARRLIHKGNESRLFSGKNKRDWKGASSWLHIVFNSSLLIFGLALDPDEVFMRWLLIERAKYFEVFPDRKKEAWYVYAGKPNHDGKQFFLEGVGVKPIHVKDYEDIYGPLTWK